MRMACRLYFDGLQFAIGSAWHAKLLIMAILSTDSLIQMVSVVDRVYVLVLCSGIANKSLAQPLKGILVIQSGICL